MGWSGYEDPREAKAAREAREQMERAQAVEDGRTEALCTAIVEGLGMVANAILAAAGKAPLGVDEVCQGQGCACDGDEASAAWCPQHDAAADAELDGLLDQGVRDADGGE